MFKFAESINYDLLCSSNYYDIICVGANMFQSNSYPMICHTQILCVILQRHI